MSIDYSKVLLNGLRDYSGVKIGQGRVLLDSDFNELTDVLDRRLRALGGDMLGRVSVSATTPDAFKIAAVPGGLTIGIGRLYVDGLCAECHGAESTAAAERVVDDNLGEARYANPIPYAALPVSLQPYQPQPEPLPFSGTHLVYLDVWKRPVSHLEQPDLVETAIGVDAGAREQIAWQVRILAPDAGSSATCATADTGLPGWADLIAPSTGTLTTGTYNVPPATDPCELPPTGGYRGEANQLYRVEIHNPGPPGVATFKWSRENASVGSRIVALVNAGEAEVESVGRDDILSLKTGDWVEFMNDYREFALLPGEMRKISVDAAKRQITFAPLPADMAPGPFPDSTSPGARNLRVRRWDQKGKIFQTSGGSPVQIQDLDLGTSGVIDVPAAATTFILEDGVTVSFGSTGLKGFRVGDSWAFAARTTDASVEELDRAPPREVWHHYARLAMWDAASDTLTDCRPQRAEGCCTFVIKPGENIQAAIDALPLVGGCVCLRAGLHVIDAPIVIAKDNITLHGESLGAIVVNRRGTTLLSVAEALQTRVLSIVFRQAEGGASPVISVVQAQSLIIEDCTLETAERAGKSIGLFAAASSDFEINRCKFLRPAICVWFDKGCADITVSACEFMIAGEQKFDIAILAREMRGPLTAESNVIEGATWGIIVNDDPFGRPSSRARLSRIRSNRISMADAADGPLRSFGIDVAADASTISDNQILHRGGNLAAIRICGSGSEVRGNHIFSSGEKLTASVAVIAGDRQGDKYLTAERILITDNIVEGPQHGIILYGVASSRVAGNILGDRLVQFGLGLALVRATDCLLIDNEITRSSFGGFSVGGARNAFTGNRVAAGQFGIALAQEESPTVSGNRLTDLTQNAILISGASERCNVIENRVVRCGSAARIAAGISATNIFGELHVESNEVMDTGLPPAGGGPVATIAYGIAGEVILEARIESNLVTYSRPDTRNLNGEDRALRMRGFLESAPQVSGGPVAGFAVQIAGNKFLGPGRSALVELRQQVVNATTISRFERVLFHGNYCAHFTPPAFSDGVATVSMFGRHGTINGNQVRATTRNYPSYDLHEIRGPFIGNVSHFGNSRRPAEFPNPEAAFNTVS
ncbi:MAG: DUF6519 domain-containing protein [Sphingomicrobium sp.]